MYVAYTAKAKDSAAVFLRCEIGLGTGQVAEPGDLAGELHLRPNGWTELYHSELSDKAVIASQR